MKRFWRENLIFLESLKKMGGISLETYTILNLVTM